MLELFPDTAAVADGELHVGGVAATTLAEEFDTPVVGYCEQTLRARARAYVDSGATVLYGVKAFANVTLLRLFSEEGLGAEVSSLGELEFALRAGVPPGRLVVHGNNKSAEELRAAADADVWLVVLDALDEVERAAAAGVRRVLVRVTPGIDPDTHDAIKTGHHGSKFGLPPDDALAALRAASKAGLEVLGLHVHLGSQLLDPTPARFAVDWLAGFAAEAKSEIGFSPRIIDLGGGLGIPYVAGDRAPSPADFARMLVDRVARAWSLHGLEPPEVVVEPGRSLAGPAGFTLYRVGVVKRASDATTYVAIDGGMSDNPRPQLYGAPYSALLANRAGEEPAGVYTVCGKHCESGDVLIDRAELPEPRRGDLLAIPGTGAYTLAMSSNYNVLPRPAAVLLRAGGAQLIRRRETIDDLLAYET